MKKIENKVFSNAVWIIGCKIIQAILNLIVNMISARYLGPSNFGLISYATSIVSFFVPIMQLGFRGILVQEVVETPEQEGEKLGTAILLNIISAIMCLVCIYSFTMIVNKEEKDAIIVCTLCGASLIFQATEMIQYWYQAKLLSKYTSITMLISYTLVSGYKIYLLITKKAVSWFAVAQALDYLIISVILFGIYKKIGGQKLRFSFQTGKKMLKKSKYYILSTLMVTIFSQTDRLMIKLMVNNTETGYYSAALTCASMSSFVFAAIIDSARPLILENKKNGNVNYEKNISKLYSMITYLSLLQCIVITFLSRYIVLIFYGKEYEPAVKILQVVVWFTTFSYYGSVRDIWILAENKQRYLWIINLTGACANVLLNALVIPSWGAVGAAFTSVVTQIFTNVVLGFLIRPLKQNNVILIKGLDIRILVDVIR